jgi:hypothetical protein
MNQNRRQITVEIGAIKYTSMLAEIRQQKGLLNCLYWIALTAGDCPRQAQAVMCVVLSASV